MDVRGLVKNIMGKRSVDFLWPLPSRARPGCGHRPAAGRRVFGLTRFRQWIRTWECTLSYIVKAQKHDLTRPWRLENSGFVPSWIFFRPHWWRLFDMYSMEKMFSNAAFYTFCWLCVSRFKDFKEVYMWLGPMMRHLLIHSRQPFNSQVIPPALFRTGNINQLLFVIHMLKRLCLAHGTPESPV